jgi:uncharacterized membrane protein
MVSLDPRAFRWVLLALLASLALNLFVAGMISGRYFAPEPPGPPLAAGHPLAFGDGPMRGLVKRMAANLPREHRPAFHAAFAEHREALGAAGKRMREAHHDVRRAIAAEPFDPAALDAALANLRAREDEFRHEMHAAVADAVGRLPPEARHHLSKRRHRPWRRDHDDD